MQSLTEENYLKAIYQVAERSTESASTNAIAERMNTKPATVTDMLKKLAAKKLVNYTPYQGVLLTAAGRKIAVGIIRKHRLWELFLVETLHFRWNEVHAIAEELEHIQSPELVERLDKFLGYPKRDPHGDLIPDSRGRFATLRSILLRDGRKGKKYRMTGVTDHSDAFLRHLDQLGLLLGCELEIEAVTDYDHSLQVKTGKSKIVYLSHAISSNILISSFSKNE